MSVPLRAVQLTEPSLFLQEHPEVQFVDLLISDMNGVVRGKRIERNSLPKVFEKGINLPASLFALDITGSTVESTGLGLDIGDADRICYPIPGTLSMEPWQKRPTAQLLMTMHELEGDPFFADPREVLRQVVARFTEMELTIVAAFELEFYLIDQENVNGRPQPPRSPISGKRPQSVQVYSIDDLDEYVECLQDIIDGARAQGIPADAIVAESAPAQFEVNLHHVADPMKACDYAVLLKRLIKNIAYDHEMDTTFMAKPYPGQAGNGLHVHISLLDKHGNNIFTSEDPSRTPHCAMRSAACSRPCRPLWPSSARTSTPTAASVRSSTCRTRRAGAWTTAPWPCACPPAARTRYAWNIASPAPTPTPTCCWPRCLPGCTTG